MNLNHYSHMPTLQEMRDRNHLKPGQIFYDSKFHRPYQISTILVANNPNQNDLSVVRYDAEFEEAPILLDPHKTDRLLPPKLRRDFTIRNSPLPPKVRFNHRF